MPMIVEAAGTAAMSLTDKPLGALIEAAMLAATEQCTEEGIIDPEVILARKMAARARVKAEAGL